LLKSVVLSHFADKEIGRKPKLPSIILCADDGMGKRTIARALVNSLGIADYRETLGKTFGMGGEGFIDFLEDATENTALFVIGGDCLSRYAQETFHKLLTRGKAKIPDRITEIRAEVEFTTKPLITELSHF